MKRFSLLGALAGAAVLVCSQVTAQDAFVLTNENTSAVHTFTNSLGFAEQVDGMIIFEGQLESFGTSFEVPAAGNPTTGYLLASLRLLAQIKLFDELPASNDVGNVQGAVAAMRDAPESSTGTYFVWASTNNIMEWVPLYKVDGVTPFAVTDGATNYITFVFNYSGKTNSPVQPVEYQVFVGATPTTQVASLSMTSLTSETIGINGVSLQGVGGLDTVSSASGLVGPLSAAIGFSVYATSDGIRLILDPVDEKASVDKWFIVKALINGEWVEIGRVKAAMLGHYEFLASYPLQVGQPYAFMVTDESGYDHSLSQPIEVKAIRMQSVMMDASVMHVTFNSEPGRTYMVLVADTPGSTNWLPASVFYPVADGWENGSEPFTVVGSSTTIKIQRGASKAFFKILKMN